MNALDNTHVVSALVDSQKGKRDNNDYELAHILIECVPLWPIDLASAT